MIKLSKPYIPELAIEICGEILKSGSLVQGKYVGLFEDSLSDYLGIENAIIVSSGTAALHLSLLALEIGPGDEVIVPAYTFPATANVVELTGAKPVFVDINLEDYCINVSLIESAITSSTRAIIPVHEFGQSADMKGIIDVAKKYNLSVIEDAACALGTEFNNKKIGTIGNLGCFSFHPRKAITTGEGGAITTNNSLLAAKIRSLRNHGITTDQGNIEFSYAGYNYRMTDFQAGLGYIQMNSIDEIINKRIHLASLYSVALSGIETIKIPVTFQERKNIFQSYHILLNEKYNRNSVKSKLVEKGIETNYGANAVPLLKYYREKYKLDNTNYGNAIRAFQNGLVLPLSFELSELEITKITNDLLAILSSESS